MFETLGNSIIEALMLGLPVIASNVGGIKEIVLDKVNGFLINPESIDDFVNALQLIIDNHDIYLSLQKNTYLVSDIINEKEIIEKLDSLITGVLQND